MKQFHSTGVELRPFDYQSRHYPAPYWVARRAPFKGWFIWGRSFDAYRPAGIICAVGMLARQGPVPRGWATKREAQIVCNRINEMS